MKPTLLLLAGLASLASAHMEMTWPPPLRSKHNPYTTNIDYDMVNPLNADGSNFPCKGYLSLLGTAAAQPVTTFKAGQSYSLTVGGGANHAGGSCQASLSFDGGKTFTVIKSFLGGCPPPGTSNWDFVVPDDVPTRNDAIFAWTWFNRIGNREMYMNCAVIKTEAAAAGQQTNGRAAWSTRPSIFVANVANGCATIEGSDVQFPSPGPDVVTQGAQFLAPVGGSCGATTPGGGGGGGGGTGTTPVSPPVTSSPPATSPPPATTSLPGNVFLPVPPPEVPPPVVQPPVVQPPVVQPPITPGDRDIGPQPVYSPCRDEGIFNCVGGTRFQRCGSGIWQPFLPVAPGTRCKPGARHDYIVLVNRRRSPRETSLHARRAKAEEACDAA